ncbi:hypothetical protein IHE44_0008954 [Lamprotornis superbus]|uniref:Epoxide hydrolase N-terminal domain-containing protein n=1 Tax=Lamprotornis superbus TaxID=245042 RepID=A0A835NQX2_9PASS|nr:hypothetical protein IHE44_0008954 [Lamprotornis superbus]
MGLFNLHNAWLLHKCFIGIMLLEVLLVLGTLLIYFLFSKKKEETLPFKDGWWGRGQKPVTKEDSSIRPFKVETTEEELSDLFRRLDQARFTEPLENSCFHYGINSVHLRKIVSYWKNQFNWKKQVEVLNKYPQFKTKIQDFNSVSAASVFYELMLRLGFNEFYTQGGDWGWLVCTNLAQIAPNHVKGLHLNMVSVSKLGLTHLLSILLGQYFPGLFGFQDEDVRRMFPFLKKGLYRILSESGYAHIQATKPDTVGCGLNDSPVGLAAYILEKFSSWTDMEFQNLEDGGLERLTVQVPTGIASFPNEILHTPQAWAKKKYTNIVSFHFMPRGGHFAAFEEPELLAKDILQFVDKKFVFPEVFAEVNPVVQYQMSSILQNVGGCPPQLCHRESHRDQALGLPPAEGECQTVRDSCTRELCWNVGKDLARSRNSCLPTVLENMGFKSLSQEMGVELQIRPQLLCGEKPSGAAESDDSLSNSQRKKKSRLKERDGKQGIRSGTPNQAVLSSPSQQHISGLDISGVHQSNVNKLGYVVTQLDLQHSASRIDRQYHTHGQNADSNQQADDVTLEGERENSMENTPPKTAFAKC